MAVVPERAHRQGLGSWLGLGGLVFAAWWLPGPLYLLALALFGLPHVLWELALIRRTAGAVFPLWGWGAMLTILALQALGRMGAASQTLSAQMALRWDVLCLLAALALCWILPAPASPRRRWGLRFSVSVLTVLLAVSTLALQTTVFILVLLAIAHNFSPLGLRQLVPVSQRPAAPERIWWMFAGVPLLWVLPTASAVGWAPTIEQGTLPSEVVWLQAQFPRISPGLLSALVLAQCLHYWAVIVKLPSQVAIWPSPRWRQAALWLCGLMSLAFLWNFKAARPWYGVAAGVHAWLEWPLLLYVLWSGVGWRGMGLSSPPQPISRSTPVIGQSVGEVHGSSE